MRYEWDDGKNRRNQRAHDGISFELAALVFEDSSCLFTPDRIDEWGEQRWHAIGPVQIRGEQAMVMLVVHVYREDRNGEEIIRIISARRAEEHEFRRFKNQAME